MTGKEWRNVACTLYAGGNYFAAVAAFLRAQSLGEDDGEFHREFAVALWSANDRDSAMAQMHKAQEKDRGSFAIAATLSNFLAALGEPAGAAKWLSHALAITPDDPQARMNRALYLIASGDWERGWREYDARLDLYPIDFPGNAIPIWKGNASIDGKLVWVSCEQGLGDQIMFSRYVPWLQAQGASVIFDSHGTLGDFSFAGDVITRTMGPAGKWKVPVHPATDRKPDYHIPLMSLPSRHRTTQANVPPAPKWYKVASEPFHVTLPGDESKKKIGLVWAGSKDHAGDHLRSMPLQSLLPITGDDRCEFYSFQVGERCLDIKNTGAEPLIRVLNLSNWMVTAACLRQLDALVTVDTAAAHLAGSLGVKTFLMLSTEPDFRWGMTGDTTPWYPSVNLIRQHARGDWARVVRRIATEIEEL